MISSKPFQPVALLAAFLLFLMPLQPAQAQTPVDAQLLKAMAAMESTFTKCSNVKFLECIDNLEKSPFRVTGNLVRTINERHERTEISVSGWLTPAAAQFSFNIDADSFRKPPASTVPVQFWRTETFAASPGQEGSGVLNAWLPPSADEDQGAAFGVLICGNLTANFKMSLFLPAGVSRAGQPLVDATHAQLKGIMQTLGNAFESAGACAAGCPAVGLQNLPKADPGQSKLSFNKPFVWANDLDEVEARVELRDAAGQPFKISSVNLSLSVGGGPEIRRVPARREDLVQTEASGVAILKVKFDQPGDYTIRSLVIGDPCFTDEYFVSTAQLRVKGPPKVESYEVIQAIRLPVADQTRFLVQNKDTIIRIVVRNQDRDPAEIGASLELSSGNQETTLFPKGSPKMILQPGVPANLANLNSTFNFLVPAALVGPRLSFRARLDPRSKLNEFMATEDLVFHKRTLNIKYVTFSVANNSPNQGLMAGGGGLLSKLYPVSTLQYAPFDGKLYTMTLVQFRDGDGVNPRLASILANTSKSQHPDILFGWVSTSGCQGSGFFKPNPVNGSIDGIKAPVAYGPATAGCSQKVLAHEVLHDFLFGHPVPPFFPGLKVGPVRIEDLGIEIVSGSLHPRVNDFDLMNQGLTDTTVWISRFTWTNLFQILPGSQTPTPRTLLQSAASEPLLLIRGKLDNAGNAVLDPIFPALSRLGPSTEGPHCLRLESASGQTLLTHCFSLDGLNQNLELFASSQFVETVTRPAGLAKVVWLRNGQVLATHQMSANAPSLVITSPVPGQTWDGSRMVQWTAQDSDGDSLTYMIQYSSDDRQSWILLEADLQETRYELNSNDVPGGERFWFRVVATDGMNATTAEVGPVQMPKKAPRIFIVSPLEGAIFATNSTFALEANGYDLEDGALPEASFSWSSDRGGALGTGSRIDVNNLLSGNHRITVAGQDKDGNRTEASVNIQVSDTVPDIETNPTSLDFGNVAVGQTRELPLTIRNLGSAALQIQSIAVNPPFALVSPSAPITVAAGATQTFTFRFTPTLARSETSVALIVNNDPDEGTVSVSLGGSGSGGGQSAKQAQVRLYSYSIRFQRATTNFQGQTYTLELTSLPPGAPPNGELYPTFDDPSHTSDFILTVPLFAAPLSGFVFLNTPILSDNNANDIPDFFEISLPLPATTSSGYYTNAGSGRITATWSRSAGSRTGTCALLLTSDQFIALPLFTAVFEILEYSGALRYTPAANFVNATLDLAQTGNSANTLKGGFVLEKDSFDPLNGLSFEEGTLTNVLGKTQSYFPNFLERSFQVSSNYFAAMSFDDGDLSTTGPDFFEWTLIVTDPNDADGDGIPDLSDAPSSAQTPLVLSIALNRSTLTLQFSITGQPGTTVDLEESTSLSNAAWITQSSVTLTTGAQVIQRPLSSAVSRFYRARVR